jgi:hypothetical protein
MLSEKSKSLLVVWVEGGNVQAVMERRGENPADHKAVIVDVDNLRAEGRSEEAIAAMWNELKESGFSPAHTLDAEDVFESLSASAGISA